MEILEIRQSHKLPSGQKSAIPISQEVTPSKQNQTTEGKLANEN